MRSRYASGAAVAVPSFPAADAEPVPAGPELAAVPEPEPEPVADPEPEPLADGADLAEPEPWEAEPEPEPEPELEVAELEAEPEPEPPLVLPEPCILDLVAGPLIAACADAAKAVTAKSINPVLGYFELAMDGGRLRITGTDGDLTVRRWCDVSSGALDTPVLVPARLFLDSLKRFAGTGAAGKLKPVRLNVAAVDRGKNHYQGRIGWDVTVLAGKRALKLTAMAGDNFPACSSVGPDNLVLDLDGFDLRLWLDRALFAAVKESSTGGVHYTNGVLLNLVGGCLDVVGCDGHRLSVSRADGLLGADAAELARAAAVEALRFERGALKRELKDRIIRLKRDRSGAKYQIDGLKLKLRKLRERDAVGRYMAEHGRSYLLPARSADVLAKLLPYKGEPYSVALSALHYGRGVPTVVARWGDTEVRTSCLDVKFPDYMRVIPLDLESRLHLDRATFQDALGAAILVCRQKDQNPVCRFEVKDGALVLTSDAGEIGCIEESLPCVLDGQAFRVALNPGYLLDVCKVLGGDQLTVGWVSEVNPVVVTAPRSPGFTYIVMPVKLD